MPRRITVNNLERLTTYQLLQIRKRLELPVRSEVNQVVVDINQLDLGVVLEVDNHTGFPISSVSHADEIGYRRGVLLQAIRAYIKSEIGSIG